MKKKQPEYRNILPNDLDVNIVALRNLYGDNPDKPSKSFYRIPFGSTLKLISFNVDASVVSKKALMNSTWLRFEYFSNKSVVYFVPWHCAFASKKYVFLSGKRELENLLKQYEHDYRIFDHDVR